VGGLPQTTLLYLLPMIFLLLFILCTATLEPGIARAEGHVPDVIEKARQRAGKMTLPGNRHSDAGQRAAERSAEIFQSPKFQEKLQCEQRRLEQEMFADIVSRKKNSQAVGKEPGDPATMTRIYLFLSSSVPEETVRAYIAAIARTKEAEIVPVLRGLVKGMDLQASARYFSRILQEDPDCRDTRGSKCGRYQISIKVDPLLFDRYSITQVPALVYVGDKDTFLVRGDMEIASLLERVNREAHSTELSGLIYKLRGNR
jgi:type-F conjugative transfer system pilin assembly protein TrbC